MNAKGTQGPIKVFRDNGLVLKVWEQPGKDDKGPFLTSTIGRTYRTDDGEWAESRNLSRADLLKLPALTLEANRFMLEWQKSQRSRNQDAPASEDRATTEKGGLSAQRDAAFSKADSTPLPAQPNQTRGPER